MIIYIENIYFIANLKICNILWVSDYSFYMIIIAFRSDDDED